MLTSSPNTDFIMKMFMNSKNFTYSKICAKNLKFVSAFQRKKTNVNVTAKPMLQNQ